MRYGNEQNDYEVMNDERLCFELQTKYLIDKVKVQEIAEKYETDQILEIDQLLDGIYNRDYEVNRYLDLFRLKKE